MYEEAFRTAEGIYETVYNALGMGLVSSGLSTAP
jgi:hypothetical protein